MRRAILATNGRPEPTGKALSMICYRRSWRSWRRSAASLTELFRWVVLLMYLSRILGADAPTAIAAHVISFDDKKNRANIAERGLAFERIEDFDWSNATIEYDRRKDYGEERFVATGLIGDRIHVLVFTHRDADIRVISLRRANKREQAAYER